MKYLTLKLIKQHLNMNQDYSEEDDYLEMLGGCVEEVVEMCIDDSLEAISEKNGGKLPLPLIQACLLVLGTYYSNRESIAYNNTIEVPMTFTYLLNLYRNYGGMSTSTIMESLINKVAELEAYVEYDKNRKLEGKDGIETQTSGQTTSIGVGEIDEGFYE